MKKLFFLLFMLIPAMTLFAQEGIKIGLGVSPIFVSQKFKDDNSNTTLTYSGTGFKFGLLVSYGFTENYSFFTGIQPAFKSVNSTFFGSSVKSTITTVEIPVALKLRSNEIGSGLFIAGKFGGSLDMNVNWKVKSGNVTEDDGDDLILPGVTFLIGAGTEYEAGFGTVATGISYHLGLTDVQKGDGEVKVNYFAVDLGFYF